MQGTWAQCQVQEDPTDRGATKPGATTTEPELGSLCSAQEKPPPREAQGLQGKVTPLTCTTESPWAAVKTQHIHK